MHQDSRNDGDMTRRSVVANGGQGARIASLAALTLAIGGHAYGQTTPAGDKGAPAARTAGAPRAGAVLEEVVVTAQKRSENLQSVPIAITAFNAEQLQAKGVRGMTDLFTVVPGLSYSTSAAALLPRIRGIGAQIGGAGNESPVAMYIDGVYIASAPAAIMKFNNIEQVSVLKGPQGTLFGRNATGGVVQITTKDPSATPAGSAHLTYGDHETVGGDLYLTGPVATDLKADLAVYYENQDKGFGRNLATGEDYNKQKNLALRSKWKWEVGPQTTARLSLDYAKLSGAFGGWSPFQGATSAFGNTFEGGNFDVQADRSVHQRVRQGGAGLSLDHDFGGVDLLAITAYRSSRGISEGDADATPMPFLDGHLEFNERQLTQEVQLVSRTPGPLKWALGAYYFRGWAKETDTIVFFGDGDVNTARQDAESYALFGQGTYDLSKATALTAGLRWTTETKAFLGYVHADAPGAPYSPNATGRIGDERLTWRLSLEHHFNDTVLGYASYNRGFKSGGFDLSSVTDPPNAFGAEVLDAYEIGVKSDLDGRRLRFNAAAYYYDYRNIQINVFDDLGMPKPRSGGPATVYGLDADISYVPVERLHLTAGASLNHSRFEDFPNAQISIPQPGGGSVSVVGNAKDNDLPLAPRWTVDLAADYEIPLPRGSLRLAASYYHNDGWYGEADNRLRQKPYDIVNASALWALDDDGRYTVELWGKNLGDTAYATIVATGFVTDVRVIAPGRSVGLTLGAHF